MNFILEELENIEEKKFIEKDEYPLDVETIEDVERSLKSEIKKSNLILQSKLDNLTNEISGLNLENSELKKENFRLNEEKKEIEKTFFKIMDIYLPLYNNNFDDYKTTILLIEKKIRSILSDIRIEETAKIGLQFNSLYHESINENVEEKENYIIKEIIEQGYLKNSNKVIRVAKVIIE